MSHYTRCRTKISDHKVLTQALADMGVKGVEYHEEPRNLQGYEGDSRPEKAEIIIPRRHVGMSSNDIGFKRQEDGTFEAIISEYDKHRYGDGWLRKLNQRYTFNKVKVELEDMGYEVENTVVTPDGVIKGSAIDIRGG